MPEDYCELCELPKSQCIHGRPPPPPPAPAPKPARVAKPRGTRTASPSATAQRPISRTTSQEAFRPHILRILQEYGGRLAAEELLVELAERMDDVLLERDRQTSPTGEVRWQTAARKERKAMIDEGLVVPAQPGIWELTAEGRTVLP